MTTLFVLGSGSSGNCFAVESEGIAMLVDAGFSAKEIERRAERVGLALERIAGIVLTHEHGDHASGASRLARRLGVAIEPGDTSLHHAEPGGAWRLVAALEQPLHANADAEQRDACASAAADRVTPFLVQGTGRSEVPDAGDDDGFRAVQISGPFWRHEFRAERGERLAHRREIARTVIDQSNHNNPFVLGSIFASRLSFAQATRSARANALNTASTWW